MSGDFFDIVGQNAQAQTNHPNPSALDENPKNLDISHLYPMSSTSPRWSQNGDLFWPASDTVDRLEPAFYKFSSLPNIGLVLQKATITTDGLIHLPDTVGEKVLSEFKMFWTLGDKFASHGFLLKRGILLWGPPGCHEKGQGVLMYNGTIRKVEDVSVGEFLMGPDGKPREVLKLCRGRDQMFKIIPVKGKPFVVNGEHVLALAPSGDTTLRTPINMTVRDYLKQSETFQNRMKLYRAEAIPFAERELLIPPYILGAWLGDGHSSTPALTTADPVMVEAWSEWGDSIGLRTNIIHQGSNKSKVYYLTAGLGGGAGKNPATNALRALGVFKNKHIPHEYLTSSINQRLELLAGLMDTDGYIANGHGSYCTIKPDFADQVAYLARSLGYAAYVKKCRKGTKYLGKDIQCDAYNVNISGDMSLIPVKLERKLSVKRAQIKNVLRTGFTVEPAGYDEFYGFVLDRDHLYLLDDFTVTHNSGKTTSLMLMSQSIIENQQGIVVQIDHPGMAATCLSFIRKIEPERPIVAIMEDLDALIQHYGEDQYLALLDGETQINKICYIATCNYPERLDKRFVDRPSRFDTIEYIGMPSAAARRVYLKAKEPSLSDAELSEWVGKTDGFSVAHLRELVILVQCFGRPLNKAVEQLDSMRIRPPDSEKSPDRPAFGIVR